MYIHYIDGVFLYRIKCAKEYLLVSALNDGEALSTLSTELRKYLLNCNSVSLNELNRIPLLHPKVVNFKLGELKTML